MKWYHKFMWKEQDKIYHSYLHTTIVLASYIAFANLGFTISVLIGSIFSEAWGFLWELKDMLWKKNLIERNEYTTKRKFDWADIAANQSGLFFGIALLIIIGWLKQMFGG